MQELKTVKVRARGTSLILKLEDSEGMRDSKIFTIGFNSVTAIPLSYARSIYLTPAAVKWIKEGKLNIVEGKEVLEEEAIAENYIEAPIESINEEAILNVITGQNAMKIREVLEGPHAAVALELAGKNADKLNQGAIEIIEDIAGISLAKE